jgi:hypothetical protein
VIDCLRQSASSAWRASSQRSSTLRGYLIFSQAFDGPDLYDGSDPTDPGVQIGLLLMILIGIVILVENLNEPLGPLMERKTSSGGTDAATRLPDIVDLLIGAPCVAVNLPRQPSELEPCHLANFIAPELRRWSTGKICLCADC